MLCIVSDRALITSLLPLDCESLEPVSGGDIHRSYRVKLTDGKSLFAKVNDSMHVEVLASEYRSLTYLDTVVQGFYPSPVDFVSSSGGGVLLMDYHQMSTLNERSSMGLGRLLAEQHIVTNDTHGWHEDNHIGLTPQYNLQSGSWIAFYREQRIAPQLKLAADHGLPSNLVANIEWLANNLAEFIDETQVQASLLHGDLWSGNAAFGVGLNRPILFDPAPYFGDREVDLAMTRLFGGFHRQFYQAYHEILPPREGYEQRIKIYNLYHALNHYSLFGASYLGLIESCLNIDSFI